MSKGIAFARADGMELTEEDRCSLMALKTLAHVGESLYEMEHSARPSLTVAAELMLRVGRTWKPGGRELVLELMRISERMGIHAVLTEDLPDESMVTAAVGWEQ